MQRLKFTKPGLILAIFASLALFVFEYFAINAVMDVYRNPEGFEAYIGEHITDLPTYYLFIQGIFPFIVVGLAFISVFARVAHNQVLIYIINHVLAIIFLTIWFGFITIVAGINLVDKNYTVIALLTPFWFGGYLIFLNQFKRTEYV